MILIVTKEKYGHHYQQQPIIFNCLTLFSVWKSFDLQCHTEHIVYQKVSEFLHVAYS